LLVEALKSNITFTEPIPHESFSSSQSVNKKHPVPRNFS